MANTDNPDPEILMNKDTNGCYAVAAVNPNSIWKADNVLRLELPAMAFQITINILLNRLLYHAIIKPLHQPRLIGEITTGLILSQQLALIVPQFYQMIIPLKGINNMEVLSNMGLMFYAFLTGLEMNLDTILKARKKAKAIAVAGIVIPMVIAAGLYALHRNTYLPVGPYFLEEGTSKSYLIWTLALSVTGFPVLADILSELKLVYTRLGRTALTAAMITDTYGWVLFTMLVPFTVNGDKAIYSVLSTLLFVVACIYVLRPILVKLIDRLTDQDAWDDSRLLFVLMGAVLCSCITDILGTHAIIGAFVFGLILPHGRFAELMMASSDDFAAGILSPLYFSGTGIRLGVLLLFQQKHWFLTLLVIFLLCIPKILSTLLTTHFFGLPTRDGFGLGLLMSTKGIMALVMLNNAWDKMIFTPVSYSVIGWAVVIMTVMVSPIINFMYKPRKRFEQNKLRCIQKLRVDAELRILACIYNARHATGMINILETFNPTRISPLHVFALYLVELTGRPTALIAAHMEEPNSLNSGAQNLTRTQVELEGIKNKFDAFSKAYNAARVETVNVMSSFETIHEDIYNSANDKRTSLILLPFHKMQSSDGTLEKANNSYKDINQNVMQSAPCSVGIFVDRDLGSFSNANLRILVIFIGGPDDREALSVAWRMAKHSRTQLFVVRLLLLDDAAEVDTLLHSEAHGALTAIMDSEKQKEMDNECIDSFRHKLVNDQEYSVEYSEIDVHNSDEISAVLCDLDKNGYDLYIVGQGNGRNSLVFTRLLEWCDCPELGVVGDILASNNISSRSSVLVVQQYGYGGMAFGANAQRPNASSKNNGSETLVVKTQ